MLENPYTNNTRCPLLQYKDSGVIYQGGYERYFLENFENRLGLEWIRNNIKRGPGIWYDWQDRPHLYLPDYLIGNTIYEIKSSYTWNRLGKDLQLQERNISKLKATVLSGYSVILVLDHKEMEFI